MAVIADHRRTKPIPRQIMQQHVYFIQAGEHGPIKVGIAEDVAVRRRHLQTGHHEELILLGTSNGGADAEAALHQRFAADRIRGEWFKPSPELLCCIQWPVEGKEAINDRLAVMLGGVDRAAVIDFRLAQARQRLSPNPLINQETPHAR